jgi:glycosyltransferase involved in cell wall biosynthesis
VVDNKPHLLFFVSEDWYFVSHRLPIAQAALENGYHVTLVTRVNKHADLIREKGINLVPVNIKRGSLNLLGDLLLIKTLVKIYRQQRPDIVHHVAIKPVIYGSVAAKLSHVPATVNALAGMGYLFASPRLKARLLRYLVIPILRLLLKSNQQVTILQNPNDVELLTSLNIVQRSNISVIRGSGVDTKQFECSSWKTDVPVIVLAARMLWDKGVGEFVAAARKIRDSNIPARFILAGAIDIDNPASIPEKTLQCWNKEGCVTWIGNVDDMRTLFEETSIVCLPSYREGLPKVLVEAASCGRPIIATDVPGCREIVHHKENGLLVPLKDVDELYEAMKILIRNPGLCVAYGKRGREIVVNEFSLPVIVSETMAVYKNLLGNAA